MSVGLILAIAAIYLAYESKSLLIGESADAEVIQSVQIIVQEHPVVTNVRLPLSL
jgi:hypothetical protein